MPSSSLLPTDPSVLFTTAGMQQFKPYYTGQADPSEFKLEDGTIARGTVSIQKCMRTSDIDEVGDESHLTFFEMSGNFSFGGYWKKEAIEYAHEFITKELGLEIEYVTVFEGDKPEPADYQNTVPADTESMDIWQSLGVRVRSCGREDNFWGPTGSEGPCGPTTEIYIKGLEVWNLVFNEYYCYPGGRLEQLHTHGIDTGMGLERLAMVVQEKSNIFETDLFQKPLGPLLSGMGGIDIKSNRIVAEHLRSAVFLISDGVLPSNKERGYVLRRLIRRLLIHSKEWLPVDVLDTFILNIISEYSPFYQDLKNNKDKILEIFSKEVKIFNKTLEQGLREFNKKFPGMRAHRMEPGRPVDRFIAGQKVGKEVFDLYQTYGFPLEVIKELLEDRLYEFDEASFRQILEEERKKHQEVSRAGVEKKFGGHGIKEGDLASAKAGDYRKTRLHTATHVIVAALEKVLGQKLPQAGSDINEERLRFDFVLPRKITPDELKQAEEIANEIVKQDLPVSWEEMDLQKALDSGAAGVFKHKYPARVKVYTIGDESNPFSRELCGGPHVTHTAEIGKITITKEESISGGRRIRAVVD